MKSLDEARREIDALDAELVSLIARRLEVVRDVAEAKRASNRPVFDPSREAAVLERVAAAAGTAFADEVQTVFRTLFTVAKQRQRAQLANTAKAGELTVAVVGLGLIGGSIYKAALRAGYETVTLHHGDYGDELRRADLVFVCLPPEAIAEWVRGHSVDFKRGATVIDICGVKTEICRELANVSDGSWSFVGGHPMAGKEVTGYANSTADLFLGKPMVLCPADGVMPAATRSSLERFFFSLGFSQLVVTSPERHDEMIAFTSQLGHVIASAYVQDPLMAESVGFTAGSFANMSRIATVNPDTWAALYLADRPALLKVLDGFMDRLGTFRQALASSNVDAIKAFVASGAAAKEKELSDARKVART